ncbi:MAG: helix-turn-helix domain-containing protein [Mycobacterium sp.]
MATPSEDAAHNDPAPTRLDPPAAYVGHDAARLVQAFDALLEDGVDLDVLLGAAARIGRCSVGISTNDGHRAFDFHGAVIIERPLAASSRPIGGGHEIWLARSGSRHDLDVLLLERLAVACAVTLRHAHRRLQGHDDPSPVGVVVNHVADENDRRNALMALGIHGSRPLILIAYDGPPEGAAMVVEQVGRRALVRHGPVGALTAIITVETVSETIELPKGARMGIGLSADALEAPRSWNQARTALRFALPSTRHGAPLSDFEAVAVPYGRLGVFSLLADYLPVDRLTDNADLAALDDLVSGPGGTEMKRTLEVVGATESVRRAAAILHMHHNTVSHRVARAEQALGYNVSEPYGRSRLMLGLVVQRLRDNVGLSYAHDPDDP